MKQCSIGCCEGGSWVITTFNQATNETKLILGTMMCLRNNVFAFICMHYINTFNQAKVHRRFFESVIMQAILEKTFETGLLLQQKKLLIEQDHRPECYWYGTQHLGALPFFLVSKYGE